jgi:hypothetical protein
MLCYAMHAIIFACRSPNDEWLHKPKDMGKSLYIYPVIYYGL